MFSVTEVLKATNGKFLTVSELTRIKGVSIDGRTIQRDELFIAIKGLRCNGHMFVADALKKGARGTVICSKNPIPPYVMELAKKTDCFIISVSDTLKAFGEIASFHRKKFDIPIVAITGSNGKTTTKEMVECVLREKWSPLKNIGTQNNLIGVPLTLLKLADKNKSAVIELGMNRRKEIKRLTEIVRPNIGVVTNIGPAHLEYLKSLEGVYRAKRELLDFLGKGDIAVLNNDDAHLNRFRKKELKIFTFGIKTDSDFQAKDIKRERNGWRFSVKGESYFIPLTPYHDIYNSLIAISIGILFNVKSEKIRESLSNYAPLENRMARRIFKGIEFIDDTYNSNPLSMENAIKTLADYRAKGKRILISGDMLELGNKAPYYHKKIGALVACSGIDDFIGVGKLMRNGFLAAKKSGMENTWFCQSKKEVVTLLKRIAQPDDVVLVKGSRAIKMEDVITCFITSFTH